MWCNCHHWGYLKWTSSWQVVVTSHDLGPQKVAKEGKSLAISEKSSLVKYHNLASFMAFGKVFKVRCFRSMISVLVISAILLAGSVSQFQRLRWNCDPTLRIQVCPKKGIISTILWPGDGIPRNPVIFSDDDWGVQSPPKRIVFRFHETILRRWLDA